MNPTTERVVPETNRKSALMSNVKAKKKIKQTTVQKITDPSLKSHVIKVTPVNGTSFHIPVVDVRDGQEQRDIAKIMLKESNRRKPSQFMKPSESESGLTYNDSTKKG